ncbi:hypothetical protein AAF712_014461 [Marasmius tenuissimus]|uniref:Fungal-type protein kinase domain-containing protein n=1 Tax=Marasmius tenuissimus TaxID=585030 RepID=A0ABR2ZC89_9AGAR
MAGRSRCAQDSVALSCLPELVAHEDFDDFDTSKIRKRLGLKVVKGRSRIARAIFLVRYLPITRLTTDWKLFMSAFWQLFYAHAALWAHGIEHGDISLNNLMPFEPNKTSNPDDVQPKLCDYDLAHFTGAERPTSFSNTGTRRFMADDLLDPTAMTGGVPRTFRHDCESFAWVLIWVLGRYRTGEQLETSDRHFDNWVNADYRLVKAERGSLLTAISNGTFTMGSLTQLDGLFQRAMSFLYVFTRATSRAKEVSDGKASTALLGDTAGVESYERQLKLINSLSDILTHIMATPLFEQDLDKGKVDPQKFEALK